MKNLNVKFRAQVVNEVLKEVYTNIENQVYERIIRQVSTRVNRGSTYWPIRNQIKEQLIKDEIENKSAA